MRKQYAEICNAAFNFNTEMLWIGKQQAIN
jgi:hypothetical protein